MFKFGRKNKDAAPVPASPALDLRRAGLEFADLTTDEAVADAVAAGRIEWIHMLAPQFGGPDEPMNMVAGPIGAAAAKDWIDGEISRVIRDGGTVSADASVSYDDGPSRVPRSVRFELGDAGDHTLHFW